MGIIFWEAPDGVTSKSKELYALYGPQLQGFKCIRLERDHKGEYWTHIVDTKGMEIILSGFAWGYRGEGPVGLEWLFRQHGIALGANHIARLGRKAANEKHIITVWDDGSVQANIPCTHRWKRCEELDRPFAPDLFDGEGVWQAFQCYRCGVLMLDPLD